MICKLYINKAVKFFYKDEIKIISLLPIKVVLSLLSLSSSSSFFFKISFLSLVIFGLSNQINPFHYFPRLILLIRNIYICTHLKITMSTDFPVGSDSKESACKNAGDTGDQGSMSGSERHPGERNGNPLQFSCLENSTDTGAWQATVHGVAKSPTGLSD